MDRQVPRLWSPSQTAAQREARRRPVFYTYMNLWPFAAVLVVLLGIFMVNVPPFHSIDYVQNLPSSLYASAQPLARAEDAMIVYVTRDGRVYFRAIQVPPEEVPELVRNAVLQGSEKKVYLAVDSRSRFADTAAVVDQIGKAGIREICFLTSKREE